MRTLRTMFLLSIAFLLVTACETTKIVSTPSKNYGKTDGKVEWIFLQQIGRAHV